jgi:hypothetical protein
VCVFVRFLLSLFSLESNNHKILSKVNRAQETTFNKISALFESKKQKIKESSVVL